MKADAQKKILAALRKNWALLLALCVGVVLLLLPIGGGEKGASDTTDTTLSGSASPEESLAREEDRLAAILSQVDGAGHVRVLLTLDHNGIRHLQQDKKSSDQTMEQKTVVLKDGGSEQTICIRQDAPKYRGAIVVAQGADSASVRLALTQAVSAVTGLGADRISVMKMQVLGGLE